MSNIFKDLKYYILAFKEKYLLQKLKNSTKRSFSNRTGKKVYGHGVNLTFDSETKKLIAQVKENVELIVKKTKCNPEALIDYIKAAKTSVYKIQNADKILNLINEEEGFICEKRGFEALYLSLFTTKKFAIKTEPMFILRDGEINKFYFLHHFYRWFSMKSGLSGFEYDVQKKFKKSLLDKTRTEIKSFSIEDILAIKEAVARDQEATDFVLKYNNEIGSSQKIIENFQKEQKSET